jgi:hypothetical protein
MNMNLTPRSQFTVSLGALISGIMGVIATTVLVLQFFGVVNVSGHPTDCAGVKNCKDVVLRDDLKEFVTKDKLADTMRLFETDIKNINDKLDILIKTSKR